MDKEKEEEELCTLALKYKTYPPRQLNEARKKEIVRQFLGNKSSMQQLSAKYGVNRTTIWRWISNFAAGKPVVRIRQKSNRKQKTSPMSKKEQKKQESAEEELTRLREENKRLSEALKMAEWSNHAKDVMIDIAEKTFSIQIRKKSGAKQ